MTSTVSKALRNIVAERDSFTCVLCTNGYTDMHHVTPRSRGGGNSPYNLVSLCRKCHMGLHREIPVTAEWLEDAQQRLVEYVSDYYAGDDGFYDEYFRAHGYAGWFETINTREVRAFIQSRAMDDDPYDMAYIYPHTPDDGQSTTALYKGHRCRAFYDDRNKRYYVSDITGFLE